MLLLVIGLDRIKEAYDGADIVRSISNVLMHSIRETDSCGWYHNDSHIGVIFTDIGEESEERAADVIVGKMVSVLCDNIAPETMALLTVNAHRFPTADPHSEPEEVTLFDPACYPEITRDIGSKRVSLFLKRALDVAGSCVALLLFAPLFVVIPILIKLTSEGPVLFRQERLGRFGEKFIFLKFRSMQVNNDDSCHREFIRNFIKENKGDGGETEAGAGTVYKIQNDPRVTAIGRILRKTSLDEIPQFINVLKGEMSLVGPRPAIPYECQSYDAWHRHRLLSVKPGITGLWQVFGRSATSFDDMVRLDLRYIREWSLWLDIKLILLTPWAMVRGKGAY